MQNNAQNARFLTFLTSKKILLQPRKTPKGQLWVRFPPGVPKIIPFFIAFIIFLVYNLSVSGILCRSGGVSAKIYRSAVKNVNFQKEQNERLRQ